MKSGDSTHASALGQARFGDIEVVTGNPSAALSNQTANLYSDLIVHDMGKGLADGIKQGGAGPDEFRTAPLWGVGQRVFFLHDGRTTNLIPVFRIADNL